MGIFVSLSYPKKIEKEQKLYGEQYQKEAMNQYTQPIQKWSKEIKSNNLCYCKVGKALTNCRVREKSPILLLQ